MARPKGAKNKSKFELSKTAVKLISKLHSVLVKEVTKFDKNAQKNKK